jgi:hypothetical protein
MLAFGVRQSGTCVEITNRYGMWHGCTLEHAFEPFFTTKRR